MCGSNIILTMLFYDTLSFPMTQHPRSWVFSCYHAYMKQIFSSQCIDDGFREGHKDLDFLLSYFIQRFDLNQSSCSDSFILSEKAPYILRVLKSLIDATVRTNLYVPEAKVFTIKIHHDLHNVTEIYRTPGMIELFVFHPDVEGVHLRSSLVSRGGIRLSDREDYRKEAFDLLQTQRLKNAVVVPDGAKAVLRIKENTSSEQGYRLFIQGLLDVMDNLDDQHKPVPAQKVRALDGVDSYLVAAPDKGTASYSGIANEIALRSGFWLKDAFASGGKTGYDHKKLGITSKGTWVSVETHLNHLKRDMEKGEPISIVGVGDMSGDVFGNGLLYSQNIKLLAAFDHRHIFLDPNPDPERSYRERCRLFHLPKSSWMDYDVSVLSPEGKIVPRNSAPVALSPALKKMLTLSCDFITPQDLILALFKIKCDVLWLAGIGTYVIGDQEKIIGDEGNTLLRIPGNKVGAKIIAEGANLGCTQKGRIAFAQAGGIVNIDAIDNCAGVLCSDHEVNFKILFQSIPIDEENRNDILQEVTPEMARDVLNQNYWQNISLYRLQEKHPHLTRSELAVNFLEAKKNLKTHLNKVNFQETHWDSYLLAYFPSLIQEKFFSYILRHVLRQDLLCTILSNHLIDVLPTFWIGRSTDPLQALNLYHVFELSRVRQMVENFRNDTKKVHDYLTLIEEVFGKLCENCFKESLKQYQDFRDELEHSSGDLSSLWKNFNSQCQFIFKDNLTEVEAHH
ncbi:NAD-specific glutamate dehydrogenase [Holospora elegans E1]|uniref:NAD-specific glutamate dehydrogenase n=2 Tax=Holospora TaxID=44747 RepID=A0A023DYA5_9PROT|nr:NAD-specific glutamate dehydrogenase [Holospora elegans E1]